MKIKRRRYLVNKPLQFTYAGLAIWILLIGIFISGSLTYYITMNTVLDKLGSSQVLSSQAYELVKSINLTLAKRISAFLIFLIIFSCVLMVLYLHRIAGPIFRIERVLREVAEGKKFEGPLKLRKKDFFKGLADAINKMMEYQKKKEEKVKEFIRKVEKYPEFKKDIEELNRLLT